MNQSVIAARRDQEYEMNNRLRVCYFGTYDADYSRNRILINGLRSAGVCVAECHIPLWSGTDDKVNTAQSNKYLWPPFWSKILHTYCRLIRAEKQLAPYDVLVLGYTGQLDVIVASLVARRRKVPLVLDVFMSLWLLVQERGLNRHNPVLGWTVRIIEYIAIHLPKALVIDTPEYRSFICTTYGIDQRKFWLVPTGADDHIFNSNSLQEGVLSKHNIQGRFNVLLYCSFIPLHGVDIVLSAAELLKYTNPDIHFTLIGEGPLWQTSHNTINQKRLDNVTLRPWMPKDQLIVEIQRADICLGTFGSTRQSIWTIQNKIYECLSAGKAVITGKCAPVERAFQHGKDLWLCDRGNPEALANAIITLRYNDSLRQQLALQGHSAFINGGYGLSGIGSRFLKILEEIVDAYHMAGDPKH